MVARYPEAPGYRRTDTSEAAARSMGGSAAHLRKRCLDALKARGPSTADELASAIGESVLSVRPRVTELKELGMARDTGQRRENRSGRKAAVMEAVPQPAPDRPLVQQTLF
jgi:hypothetical protein